MKFYLMRHAQAEDGAQLDTTRGLTSIGEKQAKLMAKFLLTQTDKIGVILHSDMKRGRDTAEIMAKRLGLKKWTIQDPAVGPDGTAEGMWKALQKAAATLDAGDEVLLISHGPAINGFSSYLLESGEGDEFHFSHASVCHYDTETPESGQYEYDGRSKGQPCFLHWMATAKLVKRLMKEDSEAVIEAAAGVVDALASLVEAPRGESLQHEKHMRILAPLRKVIQGIAAEYFTAQGHSILRVARKNIPAALEIHQEAKSPNAKKFSQTLLPDDIEPLTFAVGAAQQSVFGQALSDAISKAAAQLAADLKSEKALPGDKLATYLEDHSLSKLTGDWNATTLDQLRNAAADAYSAGGTADQIEKALKDTVESFSDYRAAMIAQTEVNDAYNYGRRQLAEEAGMEEKAWDPDGEACDVCMDNVDDGWIPIDDDFSSGDDGPTAHPNCDCSLSFRTGGDEGEVDEAAISH